MENLFTIKFIDGSSLSACLQNGFIVYGYWENTISSEVKKAVEKLKIPNDKVCAWAFRFSASSKIVSEFIDHIEEKFNKINF